MTDRSSSLKQSQKYTSTVAMGDGTARGMDDSIDSGTGDWKKYTTYAIQVDPKQGDRATEIRLCSFERPHMRAFHCSWYVLSHLCLYSTMLPTLISVVVTDALAMIRYCVFVSRGGFLNPCLLL